jgi:uncharacterized protein (TIGR00266 family)
MDIQILHGPGSATAKLQLTAGESCTAEAGAMIAMSGDMQLSTTTHKRGGKGNPLKALKRMLAGESFFLNHYTAGPQGGEVYLSANLPGDMMQYALQGENLIVQGGSFVACENGVEIDLGWQGMKSVFSGESLFWLHLVGTGKVVANSFGAIYPMAVDGEFIVDTGHIVAFNETLDFSISKAGKSWLSSFLGGEGLVCRFQGKGTVWCQSHNPGSFGSNLRPMLKPR